jgi:hypothetical protein
VLRFASAVGGYADSTGLADRAGPRGPAVRQARTVHRTVHVRAHLLGLGSRRRTHFACFAALRSNSAGESVYEARQGAPTPVLRCSSPQGRCAHLPPAALRASWVDCVGASAVQRSLAHSGLAPSRQLSTQENGIIESVGWVIFCGHKAIQIAPNVAGHTRKSSCIRRHMTIQKSALLSAAVLQPAINQAFSCSCTALAQGPKLPPF